MAKVIPKIMDSCSIIDTEDLIDTAYNGLLACLDWFPNDGSHKSREATVFCGRMDPHKEMDQFRYAVQGVYVPDRRNYWYGSFDINVDEVPDACCVWTDMYKNCCFEYTVVTKVKRFPKGVNCGLRDKHTAHRFKTTYVAIPSEKEAKTPWVHVSYFAMEKDGSIWTAVDLRKFKTWVGQDVVHFDEWSGSHLGPGALSLTADQKYLWLVQTKEKAFSGVSDVYAKMVFGLQEPYVKSLFFARDLPITATGRKRPILHWVSSHKRRIKESIEIDIEKYLRGTTVMTIENMEFEITSPQKRLKNEKS